LNGNYETLSRAPHDAMMKSSPLTRSGRSCESCMKHGRDVNFRPGLAALPESVEKSDNRSFLALSISGKESNALHNIHNLESPRLPLNSHSRGLSCSSRTLHHYALAAILNSLIGAAVTPIGTLNVAPWSFALSGYLSGSSSSAVVM
jgi:hypothetical protein